MGDRQPVEVPQYYADQFMMALGPFGCALTFGLTSPESPGPEGPQSTPIASVRMSLEHLKTVAFLIHRQVVKYQNDFGVRVELPDKVLAGLGISKDDWLKFWVEK